MSLKTCNKACLINKAADARGEKMSQLEEILDIVSRVSMVERSKLLLDAKTADLGITSMDMVEIICEIEDKFEVELPYTANMNFQKYPTLGDVIAMLEVSLDKPGK